MMVYPNCYGSDIHYIAGTQGNLVEGEQYKADGSLYRRFEYRFDSQGNLVEEKIYKADGSLYGRSEYRYGQPRQGS